MPNSMLPEGAYWEVAFEHYQWDRLEQALGAITSHGVGEGASHIHYFRLIEAEAITRRASVVRQIAPWLSLEYVPKDVMTLEDVLPERTLEACEEIASLLGWRHSVQTRLAILAEETDAPWATYPFGYHWSKEPYDKICLPNYLLDEPDEYRRAVAHEYSHVISASLSEGNAPRWLDEALAMLAEKSIDRQIQDDFISGRAQWRSPEDLELVFESRASSEAEVEHVLQAYQQAGWIGRYLCLLEPPGRLAELLRAHTDESALLNLKLRLLGRERVDGAIQSVYGVTSRSLFTHARDLLFGGGYPESSE